MEVCEALDDGDAAAEEDFVDKGKFLTVVDVGDRGWFDAEDFHATVDAPAGKFFANAGKLVAVKSGILGMLGPAGVEEKAIAWTKGDSDNAEVGDGVKLLRLDCAEVHDPGRAHATFRSVLFDGFGTSAKMNLGIHVGPGM